MDVNTSFASSVLKTLSRKQVIFILIHKPAEAILTSKYLTTYIYSPSLTLYHTGMLEFKLNPFQFQCESEHKDEKNCFNDWLSRHFITDNEGRLNYIGRGHALDLFSG